MLFYQGFLPMDIVEICWYCVFCSVFTVFLSNIEFIFLCFLFALQVQSCCLPRFSAEIALRPPVGLKCWPWSTTQQGFLNSYRFPNPATLPQPTLSSTTQQAFLDQPFSQSQLPNTQRSPQIYQVTQLSHLPDISKVSPGHSGFPIQEVFPK